MAPRKLTQTRKSRNTRAGLIFSVARVERNLRRDKRFPRIAQSTLIFLTAVLEYLAEELLDLSANVTQANKKKIITVRHIMFAISCDSELQQLLSHVTIANAGVVPKIEPELLPKTVVKNKKNPK